jgi:hypothetical protein
MDHLGDPALVSRPGSGRAMNREAGSRNNLKDRIF